MIIVPMPGAVVVVADMSLAMVSVFFNLVVITSIRRKEEIISVTFNLVILIISTFVQVVTIVTVTMLLFSRIRDSLKI